MDLISKKTRNAFEDYFVEASTTKEIQRYFDEEDIPLYPYQVSTTSGERRSLVEKYYQLINWQDKQHIKKIIAVFSSFLTTIKNSVHYDTNRQAGFDKVISCLEKDGYSFDGIKIYAKNQSLDLESIENATNLLDKDHFQEYVERIKSSIENDPALAIGSTKELVESTLKTIITKLGEEVDSNADIPKLLKIAQRLLDLLPDNVDEAKKGADIIKVLLSNLGQVVIKIAELRNLYGTGHGKENKRKGLTPRHAKLVVNAGITLCTFLLETLDLKMEE